MDPSGTPLSPSEVDAFLSPISRGSTASFRFYNASESTPSATARRPIALSMIPPPPPIPNHSLLRNPATQPSPPVEIDPIPESSTIQPTITETETNEATADNAEAVDAEVDPETVADEDAGILDANIARFLPAQGEGEPLEEAPIRPGRSFCNRQCMWIAQAWYRATENSVRGANMTLTDFQKKVGDVYEAFRLEFIEEQVLEGGMMEDQLCILYKERTNKSIYCKWLMIQRSVLDFIAYIKMRGNRPSGFSSDLDWMKVLQASFVDIKNA